MITGSILCGAIDKEKLFPGKKGKYLNITLIETPNNEHGNDYMIVQSVTKEEREAGVRGAILGNAKIIQKRGAAPKPVAPAGDVPDEDTSVPF